MRRRDWAERDEALGRRFRGSFGCEWEPAIESLPSLRCTPRFAFMRLQFVVLMLVLFASSFRLDAQVADNRYMQIFGALEEADRVAATGDSRQALGKYLEAQIAIKQLQAD